MAPTLLVSVRSAAEAEAALAGGAGWIDVKDPTRGSLGAAHPSIIEAVICAVRAQVPVSVAGGELLDGEPPLADTRITFTKWGLAGCRNVHDWPQRFRAAATAVSGRAVLTAYADAERAIAPAASEVVKVALRERPPALLFDTWHKDGSTLLDWLSLPQLADWLGCCSAAGVPVAFAGSLGVREIEALLPLEPAWLAVRGCVCDGGRNGTVNAGRVRELAELLRSPPAA